MSGSGAISTALLARLGVAILHRTGREEYALLGEAPAFYDRLFPPVREERCREPWRYSSVLASFVHAAEDFFANPTRSYLRSEVWKEEGMEGSQVFCAVALIVEGENLLLIRPLERIAVDASQPPKRSFFTDCLSDIVLEHGDTFFDSLTSLLLRDVFMSILDRKVSQTEQNSEIFSLALLDIDDFRGINDVYGRDVGDQLLAAVGTLMRQLLRREDIPARIGGEEFAVLASNTQGHQVIRMAEKLRSMITEHNFESLPLITVSIGCSTYQPGDGTQALLERAHAALAEAKGKGKNMVCAL